MTARVCIGLGANIDGPARQLQAAVSALADRPELALEAVSRVYRSPPMGPADQPDYLNAAALATTEYPPDALLDALKGIERKQGRSPSRRWGERCIDLDLLIYGDAVIATDALIVPHPGIAQRAFVLKPMIDLLGAHYRMPDGAELGTLLAACRTEAEVDARLALTVPQLLES